MKIGILDVDSHHFPNYALMKVSAYHRAKGDEVEHAMPFEHYHRIYAGKIFTFSPDINPMIYSADEWVKGGMGYGIRSRLPEEIENYWDLDYSLYPMYPFSVQFFSRGCIHNCPHCLVRLKEGDIEPKDPMPLNPKGKWIEVLDNNFFANPLWKQAVHYLDYTKQPVNLHGVDVRILDEEQAYYLNRMRLRKNIHIAWDDPRIDLSEKLREVVKYIPPHKLTCYVLIGFNSSREEDLYRIETLRSLRITPFVQPYRDYENKRIPTQYEKDLARYVNNQWLFKSCEFEEFEPRKGFQCKKYLI